MFIFDILTQLSRPGGEGRVAQVEANQQYLGKDLEAKTSKSPDTWWESPKLSNRLADTDADGLLDDEEFALAQHLIKVLNSLFRNQITEYYFKSLVYTFKRLQL